MIYKFLQSNRRQSFNKIKEKFLWKIIKIKLIIFYINLLEDTVLSFGTVTFLMFALLVEFCTFVAFFILVTFIIVIFLFVFLLFFPLLLVVHFLVILFVVVTLLTFVELMEDFVTLFPDICM